MSDLLLERESGQLLAPSMANALAFVVRRWRQLAVGAVTFMAIAGLILVVTPRTYSATTTFVPESRQSPTGNLSGIAAQFGVALPTADPSQSPAFYQELLNSPAILERIADTTFRVSDGTNRPLHAIWDIRDSARGVARQRVVESLRKAIVVARGRETNTVSITVRTRDPELSLGIATALIRAVSTFNTESRQGRAAAEVQFVAQRENVALQELRTAEDKLQAFLQANVAIGNSAALRFQQDRLSRDVSMRQQVYTTLAQSLEQARIEAVRNTPVVTVIAPPELPAMPDARHVLTKLLFAAVLGALAVAARYVLQNQRSR